MLHAVTLGLSLVLSSAPAAVAVDPGKAAGTVTFNGVTTNLTVAIETTAENLFDDKKKDTIITLADKPLGETSAGHDIELSMRARKGDLTVLMLRLDGTKLVNVSVMHKGLSGVDKLPGQWFQYTPLSGKAGGMLKLAKRDFDGKSYACDVQFTAAPAPKKAEAAPEPAPASASVAKPAPKPEPAPKPAAPATDNNAATKRFVAAMMSKDERQARAGAITRCSGPDLVLSPAGYGSIPINRMAHFTSKWNSKMATETNAKSSRRCKSAASSFS